MLLLGMIAQAGQHRAVAVQRVDVIDQAFAEVEHLHQVLVLHRCIEFLLQFAGDQFDHLQVPEVVVDVVEQQIE
ncbi:hypothetical protein PS624_04418 [Pseudomonas fluorescens]|uniref:Uncharacterized protein n=1 Tax=Pseudomonas fluorescens TaxID=294 RepID=A0A5E6W1X7_PSEFL|nr:hypothetical protein PS624_04418 [Pseudomonas fluorescens]